MPATKPLVDIDTGRLNEEYAYYQHALRLLETQIWPPEARRRRAAVMALTRATHDAKHLPTTQGHAVECARCGTSAFVEAEGGEVYAINGHRLTAACVAQGAS